MLLATCAGFVAGVMSQPAWPVMPDGDWLSLAGLVAAVCAAGNRGRMHRTIALAAFGMALGIGWSALAAHAVIDARMPESRAVQDDRIEGVVRSARLHADGGMTWLVAVDQLPWYGRHGDWTLRISSRFPAAVQVGERWQLVVRLKPPHASQNPGVADFERFLLGERTVATGYLREDGEHRQLAAASGLAAWRARLLDAALPLLGSGPGDIAADDAQRFARAVLPALVLDERSWLAPAQWRLLADTGTAHLVAISGLHVALLWGGVLWIATFLLRRRAGTLRYRVLPVSLALVAAVAYAALAGMPLPAARATLMLAAVSVLVLRDGRASGWRVLLLASTVVLAFDPLAVHGAGFWLSHGAVAMLLLLADLHRRRPPAPDWQRRVVRGSWLAVRGQAALSLLLAPLLFALFGSASLSSVAANMPAIPLVNLLALPPALAGFLLAPFAPALADPCLDFAAAVLALLWRLLAWMDGPDLLSPLAAPGFTTAGVLLFMVAVGALALARGMALSLAVAALAVLAWPVAPAVPHGEAEVCVLDVGQGLAVAARTSRHAVLYDAGPAWSGESDAGRAVVVPALRAMGARQLDLLVLSHHDNDHVGGAASVAAAMRPRDIVVGDLRSRLDGQGRRCERAWQQDFDGVRLSLLPGAERGADNDRSCVLRIAAGKHAVLLPGDITARRELELAAAFPAADALAADVLVAAHHGSRSSGSLTFLHRVSPRDVVYSAGYRNRFRHPHPATLATARRLGARTYLTAEAGATCFRLRPDRSPQLQALRAGERRFWRD